MLQCDPEKEKMVLSFKEVVEKEMEEAPTPEFDCEVGKVRRSSRGVFIYLF